MKFRLKAILTSFVVASVVTLGGVLFFFNPIAEAESSSGPLVSPAVNFFIYVVLIVALFDWAAFQMRSAYRAAFIIAASQFVLVNVDYVLAGKRGLVTAGASTLILILTWTCIAFAYSYFINFKDSKERELKE